MDGGRRRDCDGDVGPPPPTLFKVDLLNLPSNCDSTMLWKVGGGELRFGRERDDLAAATRWDCRILSSWGLSLRVIVITRTRDSSQHGLDG